MHWKGSNVSLSHRRNHEETDEDRPRKPRVAETSSALTGSEWVTRTTPCPGSGGGAGAVAAVRGGQGAGPLQQGPGRRHLYRHLVPLHAATSWSLGDTAPRPRWSHAALQTRTLALSIPTRLAVRLQTRASGRASPAAGPAPGCHPQSPEKPLCPLRARDGERRGTAAPTVRGTGASGRLTPEAAGPRCRGMGGLVL